MSKVKVAGLAAIMLALLSVVLLRAPHPPHMPAPVPPPFAGTYLSIADSDVSWLIITEEENGKITCIWNRVRANDKGKLQQQQVSLEGTSSGDRLTLSGRISGAPPIHVTAAGLREGPDIRMSLSIGKNIFYTGRYAPSDKLGAASAVLQFKQSAEAEAPPAASTGEKEAGQAAHRDTIKQGNDYIRRVREFIAGHKVTEAGYKRNTVRMQGYIENVKRAEEAGSAMVRRQLIDAMRTIASETKENQDSQATFIREYAATIVPFANGLTQLQEKCKKSGEGSCDTLLLMQNALYKNSENMQQAVDELAATYKAEYAAQMRIIEDASNQLKVKE